MRKLASILKENSEDKMICDKNKNGQKLDREDKVSTMSSQLLLPSSDKLSCEVR